MLKSIVKCTIGSEDKKLYFNERLAVDASIESSKEDNNEKDDNESDDTWVNKDTSSHIIHR